MAEKGAETWILKILSWSWAFYDVVVAVSTASCGLVLLWWWSWTVVGKVGQIPLSLSHTKSLVEIDKSSLNLSFIIKGNNREASTILPRRLRSIRIRKVEKYSRSTILESIQFALQSLWQSKGRCARHRYIVVAQCQSSFRYRAVLFLSEGA